MATRAKANLPVNYAEQLAKEAAEISKRIATPSGDRIRFNSNRSLITPDGGEGEELEVVVVDFVSSNLFYDGPFDRDNPQPPGCFAIGVEPSLLVPSPNSPNKQAETCSACPNNQFGSAGKGKACKNTRLLAVMPVAMDGEEAHQRPAPGRLGGDAADLGFCHAGIMLQLEPLQAPALVAAQPGEGDERADVGAAGREGVELGGDVEIPRLDADEGGHRRAPS